MNINGPTADSASEYSNSVNGLTAVNADHIKGSRINGFRFVEIPLAGLLQCSSPPSPL
jgi:hypothetical protein